MSIRLICFCFQVTTLISAQLLLTDLKTEEYCGISDYDTESGRIFRGQWPFMAAVYHKVNERFYFKCGSTIISKQFVITAAQCIKAKEEHLETKASDFKVRLGAFDLRNAREPESLIISVKRVILHPEWNDLGQSFEGDAALLQMQIETRFDHFIRPICLLNLSDTVQGVRDGWFVGWGGSDNYSRQYNALPRKVHLPIIDRNSCVAQESKYFHLMTRTMFCAGSKFTRICQNDMGSGLFVRINGRLHLAGMASVALTNRFGYCDVNNPAVFTNVHLLSSWIQNHLKSVPTSESPNLKTSHPEYQIQNTSEAHKLPIGMDRMSVESPQRRCGLMTQSTGLIQGGQRVSNGQFPWAVVIFRKSPGNFKIVEYVIGSLISTQHVYVEALFISVLSKNSPLFYPEANEIKLYVGLDDLDDITETTPWIGARQIIGHPEYQIGYPLETNVAIIVLQNPVELSQNVQPVCVWDSPSKVDDFVGQNAVTFGYGGMSRASRTKHKKFLFMKMKRRSDCPDDYIYMLRNLKDKTSYFCAGGDTNETYCAGDSLSLYFKRDEVWYIIATLSFHDISYRSKICNPKKPVLFQLITSNISQWIHNVIATT